MDLKHLSLTSLKSNWKGLKLRKAKPLIPPRGSYLLKHPCFDVRYGTFEVYFNRGLHVPVVVWYLAASIRFNQLFNQNISKF